MDHKGSQFVKIKRKSNQCYGSFLKALKICLNISVEPILFLVLFSNSLRAISNVTLTMEMVCSAEKNYSDEICKNFLYDEKYTKEKIIIQQSANNWGIINTIVTVLPAMFINLLAGPWSDKYGRKLPLFFPIFGQFISTVFLIAIVYTDYKFSPYVIVLAHISSGITGSYLTLLIAFSYIADITTHESRSIKFIFVEGVIMLGNPLGNLLAGYVHKLYGFGPVYIISAVCLVIALIYGMVFLKETQGIGVKDSWKTRVKYFFNLKTLRESLRACYRARPQNKRKILICLLLSMLSFVFFINLENSVAYMYGQLAFNWNQWTFSIFQSSTSSTSLIFTMAIAPILTYILKIPDVYIGIFGTISGIVSVIIMGIAQSTVLFYIGGFVGMFQSLIPPLLRACITKIVDADEIGKIFALLTSLEFATPILASTIKVVYDQITMKS
ncbi:Proton-coupled folate transporter [Nymphon striatum]|nr:Proton-coupled folate transporter [Nymphon striatum]